MKIWGKKPQMINFDQPKKEHNHFWPKKLMKIICQFMDDSWSTKIFQQQKTKNKEKKYWYWNRYLDSVEGKKRSNYSLDLRHISFFFFVCHKSFWKVFSFFQNIIGWHFYHHHYRFLFSLLNEFDLKVKSFQFFLKN